MCDIQDNNSEIKVWPPTKEELQCLLLVQRLSYIQVGKIFGVTNNAVAGKAQRWGIKKNTASQWFRKKPDIDPHQPDNDPHQPVGCRFIFGSPGRNPKTGKEEDGGWRYCQAEIAEGSRSWCADHKKVVFTSSRYCEKTTSFLVSKIIGTQS